MAMKDLIKIGVIGLGERGMGLLQAVLIPMCKAENPDVQVLAVCDLYEDRAAEAARSIKEHLGISPLCTTDYREVIKMGELDAIVIASAWESHILIATEAMKAGKYVGLEVGGAYSVEECWSLVRAFESAGTHCMLLENCCYGRREMMVLNMVKRCSAKSSTAPADISTIYVRKSPRRGKPPLPAAQLPFEKLRQLSPTSLAR